MTPPKKKKPSEVERYVESSEILSGLPGASLSMNDNRRPSAVVEARALLEALEKDMDTRTVLGDRGVLGMHRLLTMAETIGDREASDVIAQYATRWMRLVISHNGLSRKQYIEAFRSALTEDRRNDGLPSTTGVPVR